MPLGKRIPLENIGCRSVVVAGHRSSTRIYRESLAPWLRTYGVRAQFANRKNRGNTHDERVTKKKKHRDAYIMIVMRLETG